MAGKIADTRKSAIFNHMKEQDVQANKHKTMNCQKMHLLHLNNINVTRIISRGPATAVPVPVALTPELAAYHAAARDTTAETVICR